MPDDYEEYIDGAPVTARALKLTGAGDGLSEALRLSDHEFHVGDPVLVLVKGKVEGPSFKPDKENKGVGGYVRVDEVRASSAQVVNGQSAIEKMAAKHESAVLEARRLAEQEKKGIKELPLDPDKEAAAEDGLTPIDSKTKAAGG